MKRLLIVVALMCPMGVLAADQPVLGSQFVLKNPSTPERRSITVKAKETGSTATLVGDLVTGGATLTVATNGGTPGVQTYALPPGMSAVSGKPFWSGDAVRGFKYKDSRGENGPVKSAQVQLKKGVFRITVAIDGRLGSVELVPPTPGTAACVRLAITGGDAYGLQFADGRVTDAGTKLFKVTKPVTTGTCSPPPPTSSRTPIAFQPPIALRAGGIEIDLPGRAVPRLTDWNVDGVLDLLVFAGDGYVWRYLAAGATTSRDFQPGVKVTTSNGADIRVGNGYTGGAFQDITGDGRRDLVVAGDDGKVRVYINGGPAAAPAFGPTPVLLQGAAGDLILAAETHARIDVADWDGDGLLDILAGNLDGTIRFLRNTGTASSPAFAAAPILLAVGGHAIGEPYNTHPRAFDVNGDGLLDLTYGVNWHYFRLCPRAETGSTDVPLCLLASDLNGIPFNLRSDDNDDSTPDFADIDGDGVLDLIDGGLAGRVVVLRGRPFDDALATATDIMAAHPSDLGPAIAADASLRDALFGAHHVVRRFVDQMRPDLETRAAIRDWYVAHIAAYAQYLRWRHLDRDVDAFIPLLAGQCWVNLFEAMPDAPAHRGLVASACGFAGTQADILTQTGTIFVENHTASAAQRQVLLDLQSSLPPPYQVVELVTIRDYLYPTAGPYPSLLEARSGVNIFDFDVGAFSEGFPPDVPETLVDTYSIALAHELNHNVEGPAGKLFPNWYWQRKSELLKEAGPPRYQWTTNPDGTYTWNQAATQQALFDDGDWDGDPAHWTAALDAYWSTGPAAGYDAHWCRDNLRFAIEAPQEAFATLSNQYFDSSETMLQLGRIRFANGNPWCLNEVLFFAEVYAVGGDTTAFYRVDTQGTVTRTDIPIHRGPGGHIDGLTLPGGQQNFVIALNGDVVSIVP